MAGTSGRKPPALSPLALSQRARVAIMIVLAVIALAVWIRLHQRPPVVTALSGAAWPDRRLTPGAVNRAVTDADICAQDWAPGDPPHHGGELSYAKAARHTSARLKDAVFAEYHLTNPHDGGQTYEVDHLVPLALAGLDVRENLWPESRRGQGLNAWAKDRLEYRLFRLVCHPPPGSPPVTLALAQAAISRDWVAAYRRYCADEADCPAFGAN